MKSGCFSLSFLEEYTVFTGKQKLHFCAELKLSVSQVKRWCIIIINVVPSTRHVIALIVQLIMSGKLRQRPRLNFDHNQPAHVPRNDTTARNFAINFIFVFSLRFSVLLYVSAICVAQYSDEITDLIILVCNEETKVNFDKSCRTQFCEKLVDFHSTR